LEVYLNAQRGSGRRIAIQNTPLLVNQELGKVPLDAVTKQATLARLQELVEGRGIVTVDVNLIRRAWAQYNSTRNNILHG